MIIQMELQSLAKLANEKKTRSGALAEIIRDIEYLDDGQTITSAKKRADDRYAKKIST